MCRSTSHHNILHNISLTMALRRHYRISITYHHPLLPGATPTHRYYYKYLSIYNPSWFENTIAVNLCRAAFNNTFQTSADQYGWWGTISFDESISWDVVILQYNKPLVVSLEEFKSLDLNLPEIPTTYEVWKLNTTISQILSILLIIFNHHISSSTDHHPDPTLNHHWNHKHVY